MTVTICRQRDQLKWMAEVPDDRRLTSMSIAGTHESFALHGSSFLVGQELKRDDVCKCA